MKDMDKANVILEIRIPRDIDSLILSQSHYIEKVSKTFNYLNYTPTSTHFDPNFKIFLKTDKPIIQLEYAKVIG